MNCMELLGEEWYMPSGDAGFSLVIKRNVRGQGVLDVRLKYVQGDPIVRVGVSVQCHSAGKHYYERWAYRDYPMKREQIPTRRRQRSEMLRNMAHMATLHIDNLRFRSKKI